MAGRRGPGPALARGGVGGGGGWSGKFGSRSVEGAPIRCGGGHVLPMPVWWFLS